MSQGEAGASLIDVILQNLQGRHVHPPLIQAGRILAYEHDRITEVTTLGQVAENGFYIHNHGIFPRAIGRGCVEPVPCVHRQSARPEGQGQVPDDLPGVEVDDDYTIGVQAHEEPILRRVHGHVAGRSGELEGGLET